MKRKQKHCDKNKESENKVCGGNYNVDNDQETSDCKGQDLKVSSNQSEEFIIVQEFEQLIENLLSKDQYGDDESISAPLKNKDLHRLVWESAKLKSLDATKCVCPKKLIRLLTALELCISHGMETSFLAKYENQSSEDTNFQLHSIPGKILEAISATVTALYILSSRNLAVNLYLEDIIDKIIIFTEQILKNLVCPFYAQFTGVIHTVNNNFESKKSGQSGDKDRKNQKLERFYNWIIQIVTLLSELLSVHRLTDNAVLLATNIAIAPFQVNNVNDLQFVSIKLVSNIFTMYEMHRSLILNNILDLIHHLPENKTHTSLFHVNSSGQIQMISGLVLQVIQTSVLLSEELQRKRESDFCITLSGKRKLETQSQEWDSVILNKYDSAVRATGYFLKCFLNKCKIKNGERDYKALLENVIQDLLTVTFKPEWPVADLFISLLGQLLISNLKNKNIDISLKNMYLGFLGSIASKLKKEMILTELCKKTILHHLQRVKSENHNELEDNNKKKKIKSKKSAEKLLLEHENETLQILLLDYLFDKGQNDQTYTSALHFYVVKWFKEAALKIDALCKETKDNSIKKMKRNEVELKKKKRKLFTQMSTKECEKKSSRDTTKILEFLQSHKHLLLTKINNFSEKIMMPEESPKCVDTGTAEEISRYLASQLPLHKNFNVYLHQILCALTDNVSTTRAKAMKCLTSIIEIDPSLLDCSDVHHGVCYSFLDHSIPVREAAVDLVGKYVLSQKHLFCKYYDMLSSRIMDTGISVRKRVIKIFKDFCMKYPDFPKVPEMCAKIIRRINDEESVKKLVIAVFQEMWFIPFDLKNSEIPTALINKATVIAKVVGSIQENEIVFFEQLLTNFFKSKDNGNNFVVSHEPPKLLLESCKQIVDCLIHCALRTEKLNFENVDGDTRPTFILLSCLSTLQLFAKSYPLLLIDHVSTLQQYLNINCTTKGDLLTIKHITQILLHVIPCIQHPSEKCLSQLEQDLIKLIHLYHPVVIENCLACLSVIINKITKNYQCVRNIFEKYLKHLKEYKLLHRKDPMNSLLTKYCPHIRRCLFTIGLLLRCFDFTDNNIFSKFKNKIVDEVFVTLMYFLKYSKGDMPMYSLKAIGFLCTRYREFMLNKELIKLQTNVLVSDKTITSMKTQVLSNLHAYLKEEEFMTMKLESTALKTWKNTNLKEIGNKFSEITSKVVQSYCEPIMPLCLHPDITIRHATLKLIELVVHQGLIQPFLMIPYLIGAASDEDVTSRYISEALLTDTEKKYPGVTNMKSQKGFDLSYTFQIVLQSSAMHSVFIRGFRCSNNENPTAINSFLYSLIRNSIKSRRALISCLLKQFDNYCTGKFPYLLYIADNLAYFPYVLMDEPMFVIHKIDAMILVCGTHITENFHETLLPSNDNKDVKSQENFSSYLTIPKANEHGSQNVLQIPQDIDILSYCVTAIQSCILLIDLREFLKTLYSIQNDKIMHYTPQKPTKVSEKTVKLHSSRQFSPRIIDEHLQIGTSVLTDEEKKMLVNQYLIFKEEFEIDLD